MPTQGNNIGIYVNLTGADYEAYKAAVALGDDSEDTTVVLDYTLDTSSDSDRDAANEGNWVLIAAATSATLNLSNTTSEVASKEDNDLGGLTGNSVRNVSAGNQTWNMSVDGLISIIANASPDNHRFNDFPAEGGDTINDALETGDEHRAGFTNLMRAAMNRTQLMVAFSTGEAGVTEYVGQAFVSQIDATAAVGDFATYSATFEGNGTLNKRDTDISA